METINLVAGTVIAQIVKLVSKKRKARIAAPKDVITLGGMYWDGGSRTDYFVVTMRDGAPLRATQLQHTAPPQFGGPQTEPTFLISPGQVLVAAGTFCGKPATPVLHFHPTEHDLYTTGS